MSHFQLDKILVVRAKAGDKRAFDLLVQKYQYRVVKLVGRYVHEPAEMLDVSQEVFIKAYRALPSFRGESSFYTWLYRIAINTAKNTVSAKMRRPPTSDVLITDAELLPDPGSLVENNTPEHELLTSEIEETVFEAIDALPRELRQALTLREFEGLSYEDIAHVMDCPIGTVRSRIFRARESIEQAIAPLMRE